MKYIKKYNLFEAVIIPSKIESNTPITSFEDLVEYGSQNDFDVVEYDEFYDSLSVADKKTAPPRRGVPFFALFHPERNKPMFVVCDRNVFRMFPMKEIVDDIIGHEKIHGEQISRRSGDLVFNLPNPMDRKAYFSNKEEIMAFSWTIANGLSKTSRTVNDAIDKLDGRGFDRGEWRQVWGSVKQNCDEKVIKRYRKYIYMYLDKILNKEK